ncbi:uncharacterized protein LOC120077253 [Benincasa hispida]|uniref:uncharacterized protein LOC120077251 n=1 Tax=Benincasa hispida TaxID=102211 RepID=UPI001900A889|nr:uncharacterized protein LOC120077251 [Benincasa hispida]XP_038887076.1 uncharacterized protein LOC120077253 [Benincasa hispida]
MDEEAHHHKNLLSPNNLKSDSKMSFQEKEEWLPIPDVTTPCVKEIVNFVVNQHNKESGDDLVLKGVIKGWFKELSDVKTKHRLYIEATNNKGVVQLYEAIVCVIEKGDKQRVRTLLSFHVGYLDENEQFWIEIPNVEESCVQEVAKFAVAEYNKQADDNLVYICTTQGWYQEVNAEYGLLFDLRIKTKDCFGRVREYKALVSEDRQPNEKIRILISFKLVPKKS